MKDDVIRSADDLRNLLKEAAEKSGMPEIPLVTVEDINHPTDDEVKKIVDLIRKHGDGTAQ